MKFLRRKMLSLVKRQVSFSDDVLLEASLFGAATNMGKCIVAIVEDILAPKIINTLVPLLFALWAVSDPAINYGFAAELIFSAEATESATHFKVPTSGATIDVLLSRGNEDAFTRNLHFLFILNIFFVILP
nr:hypothetical protein CFP56_76401 [Quercus suber]